MFTKGAPKPVSHAGFFEKNFRKLKEGQHWEYMLSRIITFFAGVSVGLYYIRDAAYVHTKEGIPESILAALAIIFLMNGLRKMVRGFIKLREAAWDGSVVEKPHNPGESWLMRLGFRFPLGQRRHLVSAMTLASEGLAAGLMVASFVAISLNEQLFVLSWEFPFVLKPFIWSEITFPANLWLGLAIAGGARLLSYFNSSIFLTKIPQVRRVLAETFKGLPHVEHLGLYFPLQIYKLFRSGGGVGEKPCQETEAREIAVRILAEYPEEVIASEHKEVLLPELVLVICQEHDERALLEFLDRRVRELKLQKTKEKSDETTLPKS